MKKILIPLVVAWMMMPSCDLKDVKLYPSMSESTTEYIHHQGSYYETGIYNVTEIKNSINDLDAEGRVTDVMIEGLYLNILLNTQIDYPVTTATSTSADLILTDWDGIDFNLADDVTIELNKTSQTVNLHEYLDSEGVNQLRDMLFDVATNAVPAGATEVRVALNGVMTPVNGFVNAQVDIVIDLSIEFTPE